MSKNMMDSARDGSAHAALSAKDAVTSASQGTGHAISSAVSTMLDVVKAVGSVVGVLRSLGIDDALGWAGLTRRRGQASSFALFGAGIVVGAGAGLLLAPMSGADLRRALVGRASGPELDAKEAHSAKSTNGMKGPTAEAAKSATET